MFSKSCPAHLSVTDTVCPGTPAKSKYLVGNYSARLYRSSATCQLITFQKAAMYSGRRF
jgi:hypothetical protein